VILHPASLLLGWFAVALVLQWLPLPTLTLMAGILFPAVLRYASQRFLALLRKARWLLLSIGLLFALATPGSDLPGLAGAIGLTDAGVALAATHVLRLCLLLALLALMLEHLGIPALVAGLYHLLAPLGKIRERIALRLLLVLEYVEQGKVHDPWRDWLRPETMLAEYPPLCLCTTPLGTVDYAVMGLTLSCGVWGWWGLWVVGAG
jgi:hypothetical protein